MPAKEDRYTWDATNEAADFLRSQLKALPKVAVQLGTGLGDVTRELSVDVQLDYQEIPRFPVSTVQSHQGCLLSGTWAGCPVVVLQGRFHLYEGYSSRAVTFPVRVMQTLGVDTLVLTNASGGLNPSFHAGDTMLIRDHINLTADNPLVGPNTDQWGPRFPEMTAAYAPYLRELAGSVAERLDMPLPTGVYVGLRGPSLETPAEMRYLRTIGADAVGFSTVMENIAAVHAGMQVLGLSTITNLCVPNAPVSSSVEEIIATAHNAAPLLGRLIAGVLEQLISK